MKKYRVAVFGSTGSIGTQTLDVIREHRDFFEVYALTADTSCVLLAEQIKEFNPHVVRVRDEEARETLERILKKDNLTVVIHTGDEALKEIASSDTFDIGMLAITGFAAFPVLIKLMEYGKAVALANKESLIVGGALVKSLKETYNTKLIPVDSEHNSIFQCLAARPTEAPHRVMITASGGPFLHHTKEMMKSVTPEQAVKHPRWNMGAKISVDSATLMNKALEVIEAIELFSFPPDLVEVVIHPQHVIHAMVEYTDGSTQAILYDPDMRVPITHALYACSDIPPALFSKNKFNRRKLDFSVYTRLDFALPDEDRFPCLRIAREAQKLGGDANIILNWANEVAVHHFLQSHIQYLDIPIVIEKALTYANPHVRLASENDVLNVQEHAKNIVDRVIQLYL